MKITVKVLILEVFTLALASVNVIALAGTTQIYSPAGLPKSSNQQYSNPVPVGISPAETFPTAPIPLNDASSLAIPNAPLKDEIIPNGTKINNDQTTQSNNSAPTDESGSVESIFQYTPSTFEKEQLPPKQNKAVLGGAGKFIWHTLDNLGVPMLIGKDPDLDPSLYSKNDSQPKSNSSETTVKTAPQKIPQSELEGIEIPAKNDAKSP